MTASRAHARTCPETPRLTLVQQDTPHSCGLACIAMVLGIDMDAARELVGRTCEEEFDAMPADKPWIGFCSDEMVNMLFRSGIPTAQYIAKSYYPPEHHIHIGWDRLSIIREDQALAHIGGGGTAIVGVNSLNFKNGYHWIMISGGEIFDPGLGKTYDKSMAPIDFDQAILIGEASQ